MSAVCGYSLPREVKSPVCAINLDGNWIGLSIFKQTAYFEQFRRLLAAIKS